LSTAARLVKRQKRLAADSLPRFSRPEQKLKFEMRPNGEDEFVPFYWIGFHESYEMYFDFVAMRALVS